MCPEMCTHLNALASIRSRCEYRWEVVLYFVLGGGRKWEGTINQVGIVEEEVVRGLPCGFVCFWDLQFLLQTAGDHGDGETATDVTRVLCELELTIRRVKVSTTPDGRVMDLFFITDSRSHVIPSFCLFLDITLYLKQSFLLPFALKLHTFSVLR
ncbi:hypothetical protein KSP40_PGU006090 [Platanthera guangdongensis]|uniref:Uncharacterized protein n=1 Tax=Platanthera guangdongensis TaxID=2320717 RepID=A0ABR2LNZ4_9ASPA